MRMSFLHDNEILYKKCLKDYKDRSKREAVWHQFCEENNLEKDAFSEFRAPKGSASQTSAAVGSASRKETVHMEPYQDISRPEST